MTTGAAAAALLVSVSTQFAHAAPAATDPVGFGPASSASWLASAVAGYNWQRGGVVFGLESDVSWTNLKSVTSGRFVSAYPSAFVYPSEVTSARVDWYGTVRARLGWTTGSFLFYGTGGLAYGNVSLSNRYDLGTSGQTEGIAPLSSITSGVRFGWTAGAGVDYMLNQNLILNFEYRYVDLGTLNLAAVTAPSPLETMSSSSASVHARFQTVMVGLSYKFGPSASPSVASAGKKGQAAPPPPSDPWQGLYIGGRAGGAWGNNVNVTTPVTRQIVM
ncbi:outer membrane protein [Bradyrhizobium sp.]|uniref:outer membrane protein n=1 Tax=Bradyrhizobium sp. TaxID=376 RepID=UPI0039E31F2B